ncbi:MAG: metallophosphoesterase family protein [Dehalococcoidia bacterium]
MNVLIVGDIHGNLEALQEVLGDAERHGGFQALWCLGDIVGYGPDPGPCLDLIRGLSPVVVAGNHDRAAAGLLKLETFNSYAAEACRWTTDSLSQEQIAYLKALPLVQTQGAATLVHGSLRSPDWEYLVHEEAAVATFALLPTNHCFVGHSHVPFLCREAASRAMFEPLIEGAPVPIDQDRVILNPGSVGQPRDRDVRASYALYDTDAGTVVHRRVAYDIPAIQEKMTRAGLPTPLITRLAVAQ